MDQRSRYKYGEGQLWDEAGLEFCHTDVIKVNWTRKVILAGEWLNNVLLKLGRIGEELKRG